MPDPIKDLVKKNRTIVNDNKKKVAQWSKNGIIQSAQLTPQIDDDNWGIMNDSIFGEPFSLPYSCANTIVSNCMETDTVEECKEICKKDPLCNYGSFIKMKGKNYCLPFFDIYDRPFHHYNPLSSIWDNFDNFQTANLESSTFLNFTKYSPWKQLDYSMYFADKFLLQPLRSKLYLNKNNKTSNAQFSKEKLTLQLSAGPLSFYYPNIAQVFNYSIVSINIYNSYSILQKKISTGTQQQQITQYLIWANLLGTGIGLNSQTVTIICLDKQPGEILTYYDTISFAVGNMYVCTSNFTNDCFCYDATQINNSAVPIVYQYKLIPTFDVTYCDNISSPNLPNSPILCPQNGLPCNPPGVQSIYRCITTTIDQCKHLKGHFYYELETRDKNGKTIKVDTPVYRSYYCANQCKDAGAWKANKGIPLKSKEKIKILTIDQTFIAISILILSIILLLISK